MSSSWHPRKKAGVFSLHLSKYRGIWYFLSKRPSWTSSLMLDFAGSRLPRQGFKDFHTSGSSGEVFLLKHSKVFPPLEQRTQMFSHPVRRLLVPQFFEVFFYLESLGAAFVVGVISRLVISQTSQSLKLFILLKTFSWFNVLSVLFGRNVKLRCSFSRFLM